MKLSTLGLNKNDLFFTATPSLWNQKRFTAPDCCGAPALMVIEDNEDDAIFYTLAGILNESENNNCIFIKPRGGCWLAMAFIEDRYRTLSIKDGANIKSAFKHFIQALNIDGYAVVMESKKNHYKFIQE